MATDSGALYTVSTDSTATVSANSEEEIHRTQLEPISDVEYIKQVAWNAEPALENNSTADSELYPEIVATVKNRTGQYEVDIIANPLQAANGVSDGTSETYDSGFAFRYENSSVEQYFHESVFDGFAFRLLMNNKTNSDMTADWDVDVAILLEKRRANI